MSLWWHVILVYLDYVRGKVDSCDCIHVSDANHVHSIKQYEREGGKEGGRDQEYYYSCSGGETMMKLCTCESDATKAWQKLHFFKTFLMRRSKLNRLWIYRYTYYMFVCVCSASASELSFLASWKLPPHVIEQQTRDCTFS